MTSWTPPQLLQLREALEASYPEARCALDHRDPFQLVVATILSAQCTDARVNLTTPALFARYPDPWALASADAAELEALVRPTGFFRAKAKHLVGLAQALVARHGGEVPRTRETLAALPGVGPKTASVVLANAFGVPALAVDTHVFRVARRLGLAEAGTPEKVEAELCRLFPQDAWIQLHHQLIWHGRRVCAARRPACPACPLRAQCPTGRGLMDDPHSGAPVAVGAPEAPPPDRGDAGPARIVSLVPSVTECLAQWGLGSRLVGRTRFCVEPRWLRASVPALGGPKDPDLEALRGLRPDLVVLERQENRLEDAEALRASGIPTLVLEVDSVRASLRELRRLGRAVGCGAQADAEARDLEARLEPAPRRGPRTLVLVWREPWIAAGTGTYVADLARQAGGAVLGGKGYPRLSDEELVALHPARVLLPTDPFPWKARHLQELRRLLPDTELRVVDGRAFTWFLSRTEAGLEAARALRPR